EDDSHPLFASEPARACDLVDVEARVLEQASRRVQSEGLDRLRRRTPHPVLVYAREVPRAHPHPRGETVDSQLVVTEIVDDPAVKFVERFGSVRLRSKQFAVL